MISGSLVSGYWVVVPAAGVGKRMGADRPKQYLPLLGRPLLSLTLSNILTWPGLSGIVVALSADDVHFPHLPEAKHPLVHPITGGAERADSVLAALNFLATHASEDTPVLVHDAARPCVALDDISALLSEDVSPIALLAQPASDTVKLSGVEQGCAVVEKTLDRNRIWLAQTPQRAPLGLLHSCLRRGLEQHAAITDESSALELFGHSPQLVPGRRDNIKVTHPADIVLAETILRLRYAPTEEKR
ncbi:2-C-methyl-D-erythritol 4-phosphate cytidylyltransferase [Microbulbifer marinus]|uniref:2-C-methyl-D-erythritol 4-phosphate cytidylyltransferase n=1 Tax=Microbulbifer marinus TaxID=658218 RepID=A0A1H3ZZE8_9GAMM|nr:2-C-methyl-D-erythritol 4-phosphate cytidylyltransferase [Microbulbifer marinus]SEA29030.1 2-C-methyl-D-erythritol 4-phosphate cytidylyltransferase [Microbulbifer marinus]